MTANPPPPPPSDDQVVAAVRRLACEKRIVAHPRCQSDMRRVGFDIESANELLADCDKTELVKNEPDYDPTYNTQTIVLEIELEEDALYVKVALHLPNLGGGYFLSFKEWSD